MHPRLVTKNAQIPCWSLANQFMGENFPLNYWTHVNLSYKDNLNYVFLMAAIPFPCNGILLSLVLKEFILELSSHVTVI